MIGTLVLGFLIGLRHAVETDHVAAVASLASRSTSLRQSVRLGVLWGVGHTITLFMVGAAVLTLDTIVPEDFARVLETVVGVMLVVLGGDVLYSLIKERIHFHAHRHGKGALHFHAHSHAGQEGHGSHDHNHRRDAVRAVVVGLIHGLAGSAALVLLTLMTTQSLSGGLAYIALFGIGSIGGMALLSLVIALPMQYAAKSLTWFYNGMKGAVGVTTMAVGILTVHRNGLDLLGSFMGG